MIVLVGVGLPEEEDSAVAAAPLHAPGRLPSARKRNSQITPWGCRPPGGSHVLPAFSSKRIAIGSWIAPSGLVAL